MCKGPTMAATVASQASMIDCEILKIIFGKLLSLLNSTSQAAAAYQLP